MQKGVANVGRRPTCNAGRETRLNVNTFDFATDLCDTEITVSLRSYVREERRQPRLAFVQQAKPWMPVLRKM